MYLSVLGRQSEISIAELEALYFNIKKINSHLASFDSKQVPNIDELGGSIKIAEKLSQNPIDFLQKLPEGKLTIGISDYSKNATRKSAMIEALKIKKILTRHERSTRVVENQTATLSTATSLHNGLSGKNNRKIEFIKSNNTWYKVIGVQNIDAYSNRDQTRPARDAKVGMLPPKLAQILINLCGPLSKGSRILDPFCGTGVVLQEALLMGYHAYGTDINERMVDYSEKNLKWLFREHCDQRGACTASPVTTGASVTRSRKSPFQVSLGDATSFKWEQPIDAVACEGYLGKPMSQIPNEIKLKTEKQECSTIILSFLENLANQIKSGTPVVIACPAWLREDGTYSRLEIIDNILKLGYNVNNKSHEGLLYHREKQIVARDIIILRKD